MTVESPPAAVQRAHGRIDSLQILRFVAATLVVVGHSQHELVMALGAASAGYYGFVPLDWGLGVDIFFIISGFIMWHLMQDRFAEPGAPLSFLRRRLIRIAPLYWLTTAVIAVGTLRMVPWADSAPFALASYAFLPWPHPDGRGLFPILTLGWTLNYEMMFYIVFTAALFLPRRLGIAFLLLTFATLCLLAQGVSDQLFMVRFWGNPIIGEFLIGIGIAALYRRGVALSRGMAIVTLVAGVLLAIVSYQTRAFEWLPRVLTGGIPAALIVSATLFGLAMKSSQSRLSTLAILGGDASYALYLVHPFALKAMAAISARLNLWQMAPLWVVGAMVLAAIVAAVLTFTYVEQPILRALNRRFSKGQGRTVAAGAGPVPVRGVKR